VSQYTTVHFCDEDNLPGCIFGILLLKSAVPRILLAFSGTLGVRAGDGKRYITASSSHVSLDGLDSGLRNIGFVVMWRDPFRTSLPSLRSPVNDGLMFKPCLL